MGARMIEDLLEGAGESLHPFKIDLRAIQRLVGNGLLTPQQGVGAKKKLARNVSKAIVAEMAKRGEASGEGTEQAPLAGEAGGEGSSEPEES